MPRNGSGVYSLPSGLPANGETSNATDDILTPFGDLETDMNTARPIVAGGTGATSASAARTNLGLGTIATQASTSVDIDGGAIDGTTIGANSAAAGTFTTCTVTTADINGGAIDGTTIGASSAAAGTFTSVIGSSSRIGTALSNVGGTPPKLIVAFDDPAQSFTYDGSTELVVARQSSVGVTLATDTGGTSRVNFADALGEFAGSILYDHSDDTMDFNVGGTNYATLSAGQLLVNDRVNIQGSIPELLLDDTDAGVNEGVWRIALDSTNAYFQTRTDANGAGENYHVITRSGTGVTQQTFGIGGATKLTLSSSGAQLASGATVDTIETTLTDDDTHLPTSGAVVDYVASELAGIPDATVLLGTLTTTSGSSQSLTGQDLSGYKFVRFVFDGVSTLGATTISVGGQSAVGDASNSSATWRGIVEIDLATGVGTAVLGSISGGGSAAATETRILETSLSTASTTLAVATDGTLDAGSVKVYGIV